MSLDHFELTVPGTDEPLRRDGDRLIGDGASFEQASDRIWDMLPASRRAEFDAFERAYAEVRAAEGRVASPDEVRRLPDTDADHPLADMWRQRRASFDRLCHFLGESGLDESSSSEANPDRASGGRLVDIGAGCGWLAAHLAADGWHAAAVDVVVEGGDGLGAAAHHDADLLLLRADMEALPFASGSIDLAVFNASLHYAADIDGALAEARRVLGPDGVLVVLDSPVFTDPTAGAEMVQEFADHARRTLGVEAATNAGPGYVTATQVAVHDLAEVGAPSTVTDRTIAGLRRIRGRVRAGREIAARPLLVAPLTPVPTSTPTARPFESSPRSTT